MNSISSTALCGMNAAMARLNVAADNIAKLNTPGFRRQELQQSAQPGGGVGAALAASRVPGASLEADVLSQLQAKNAFLANLAVFKTSNTLAGTLLDDKV
ncbi:MAG: flagellar basal body protein [Betaproteobacteria bacterium]